MSVVKPSVKNVDKGSFYNSNYNAFYKAISKKILLAT